MLLKIKAKINSEILAKKAMKFYFIIACLFVFSAAQAANDKAFFWKISSTENASTAVVYLVGSIHFADNSFYPLRQKIIDAYQQADALVVELDISKTDHQVYNKLLTQRGIYKDGRTIKDVIAKETWLQLRQRLQYLNIDYDTVKKYKPGVLVLTLSAVQVMRLGYDPELGIDAYFLSKAMQQNLSAYGLPKEIIELETLEQQLNLFLNIPNGDLLLKESLYSLDEAEALMTEMVRYWKAGDEKKLSYLLFEQALIEYPAFSAIYDSLFYDRNENMMRQIEEMLKQPEGSHFVVVGSGHLIGDKGIVQMLRDKGYVMQRL